MLPFIRLINLEGLPIEAQFIQSSIALECLGYALTAPRNLDSRGQLKFSKALTTVYRSLQIDLLDDPEGWARMAAACYRGVKHPDNQNPDVLDLANTHRDNIIVLRAWVALSLGLAPQTLRHRLERDRQASARYAKTIW
jgi:hypothetical protein